MIARTTKLVPPAKSGSVSHIPTFQSIGCTRELVELEAEGNRKEEELVCNSDQEGNGEVIVVQDVYDGHLECLTVIAARQQMDRGYDLPCSQLPMMRGKSIRIYKIIANKR
jgi:hypothetical protein